MYSTLIFEDDYCHCSSLSSYTLERNYQIIELIELYSYYEHLKSTAQIMSPIYVRLINLLFDNSIVPENWSLGNILPIYKMKGDINAPEN